MAYQIDKFNGSFLVSIDDQTLNTTATDLRLVGRNYAGYGEIQNENFVHLLENFASTAAPPRSITGQIWYDSSSKKIKVYDGVRYKVIGGAEASPSAPAGLAPGDFWFDTVEQQVYTWTGTEFILVGPDKTPTAGDTTIESQEVRDLLNNSRVILKLIVGGKTIAIISKDEFTLNDIINPIEGFSDIRRGINLADLSANGFSTDLYRVYGTVSNSLRLNGFTSDDFLRSSNTIFNSEVKFKDNGFTVGDQNDLKIYVANGNEPIIENSLGGNLIFRVKISDSEVNDVSILTDEGIFPGRNDIYDLGRPGIRWKEVNAETVRADTFYGKFVGTIETPPAAPGQPVPPLTIENFQVVDNFSMTTGNVSLVDVDIDIRSTTGGIIDNVDVNPINPRTGSFTNLTISGNSILSNTTQSTSTTTGALRVSGGVGISGNLNVGGDANFVGSGTLTIPVGTTAQRPPSAVIGMIRFNIDIENFEGFDGERWRPLGEEASEDYGDLVGAITISLDYNLVSESVDTELDYGSLF